MASARLDGVGVLVTRPRAQAAELVEEITGRGGTCTLFPVIDIVARDADAVRRDAAALPEPDITIFVSRNAVEHGIGFAAGKLAAIGPSTADAITAAGANVAIQPALGFSTEHLLDEAAFADVRGRTIRIIRGNGGRETLAATLRQRGARVDYLSTYERRLPVCTDDALLELEARWRAGAIDAVVVMSVESLLNLTRLLTPWCLRALDRTRLVTPAARVLKEVLARHPDCPAALATGPEAADIADCLAHAASPEPPAT